MKKAGTLQSSCLIFILELSATFRAVFIFRGKQIATIGAIICSAGIHPNDGQIFLSQSHIFTMLDSFAQLLIDGIDCIAAIGNGIILFAPLEKRNKKEAKVGIDHKNRNTAVASAFFANHGLSEEIKILSALGDPADKYHKNTSCRFFKEFILQVLVNMIK